MIVSSFTIVLAALAAEQVAAQYQTTFGPNGNVTGLTGFWSTGSGAVKTGQGFANPLNRSFTYPKTAGYAFSFTDDGWFEESRYRFTSNGSEPTCITGVIGWTHGTYQTFANGSITLHALEDGFQQIQDPCAAVSNFIETYNQTEYYTAYQVYTDLTNGITARLYAFDGQPLPPMTRRSQNPNMLPKQKLANASATITNDGSVLRRRDNAASPTVSWTWTASGLAAIALGLSAILL